MYKFLLYKANFMAAILKVGLLQMLILVRTKTMKIPKEFMIEEHHNTYNRYIVTAAHCVTKGQRVWVHIGDHDKTTSSETHSIRCQSSWFYRYMLGKIWCSEKPRLKGKPSPIKDFLMKKFQVKRGAVCQNMSDFIGLFLLSDASPSPS